MFKPNIRGYPKAQLRFTLFGWNLRDKPESIILHRFPWRRSWIKQLGRHPEAQPVLSRLGRTHLVVDFKNWPTRTIPKLIFIALALFTILLLAVFSQAGPGSKQDRLSNSKPEAVAPINSATSACPVTSKDYSDKIRDWLGDRDVSPIDFSQESQIQIGGVRSTVVLISCQSSQKRFRVTEVKQRDTWEFKETAQLDN